MLKLAIFDLDGTLLDTRRDIAEACNHALRMCGYPVRPLDEYNMLIGRGIGNLFRGALPEDARSAENIERMRGFFKSYYELHICDFTEPYDGVYEMLDALSEAGIHLAVASNKYQEGTERLVRHFFERYRFSCILGHREGKALKPDPDILLEAMASFCGVSADETAYCGDSDVDMQTGRNAGIRTIGATWGFRGRKELEEYDPWALADNPHEISSLLLSGIAEKQ